MSRKDWTHSWGQMSDGDLEQAARYYLWLSVAFPDLHTERLAEIIAEVERRGRPDILAQARASVVHHSSRSANQMS